jgi:hypothetical protein
MVATPIELTSSAGMNKTFYMVGDDHSSLSVLDALVQECGVAHADTNSDHLEPERVV